MAKRMVCRVAEVPENTLRECELEGGLKLVVANAGGEFVGFQAICPHQDVPLCEGMFDGATLTCHMHLWQWDVRTGAPLGIAEAPLERYPLVREGDALFLGGEPTALDVGELFNGLEFDHAGKAGRAGEARKPSRRARCSTGPGDPAEDFFVLDSGRVEFLIGRGEHAAPGRLHAEEGRGVRLGRAARRLSAAHRERALPGRLDRCCASTARARCACWSRIRRRDSPSCAGSPR